MNTLANENGDSSLIERLRHPIPHSVCSAALVGHFRLQLIRRICESVYSTNGNNKSAGPATAGSVVAVGTEEPDYAPEMRTSLELAGYFLGVKITDRLTLDRARFFHQRDCLKFVCREVWQFFFRKQADRLQTNKKGGYIILDETAPWLEGFPLFDSDSKQTQKSLPTISGIPAESNQSPAGTIDETEAAPRTSVFAHSANAHACVMAGIIRGALTVLCCPCSVAQELREVPSCSFHITVLV